MDKKVLYRTIEELRQQCRLAQASFQSLRLRLNELDQERVFLYVHAFLGHAVMISRLLWPARPASAERGETLRKELDVPPDSALRMTWSGNKSRDSMKPMKIGSPRCPRRITWTRI